MKIILRQDLPSLGKKGAVVKVAEGHGRNYLIPRQMAYLATPANLRRWEEENKFTETRGQKEEVEAKELAGRIGALSCTITKKVGENEMLYGSVTNADIAAALKGEGLNIDRRKILLEGPVKKLGIYSVPIRLHPQVTAELRVWVVKE